MPSWQWPPPEQPGHPERPSGALTRMKAEALHDEWVAYLTRRLDEERKARDAAVDARVKELAVRLEREQSQQVREDAELLWTLDGLLTLTDPPDVEQAYALLMDRFPPMASSGGVVVASSHSSLFYLSDDEAVALIEMGAALETIIAKDHPFDTATARMDEQYAQQERGRRFGKEHVVRDVVDVLQDELHDVPEACLPDLTRVAAAVVDRMLGIYEDPQKVAPNA